MEYITLGKTQSKVSKISLGTWSYGGASTSGNQSVGGPIKRTLIARKLS